MTFFYFLSLFAMVDFSPKRKRSETAFSAQPSDRVFCVVVVVVVVCLFVFFAVSY